MPLSGPGRERPPHAVPRGTLIGTSLPRKEDHPLLTGSARFVGDLERPGMAHAFIVRSFMAHARLLAVDVSEALAKPGILAVYTARDLPQRTPPIPMRMHPQPGMERFLQPPLARDLVRYAGEPVAVVVADSPYLAEDAAELVQIEYEELGPVVEADRALETGAPILHPESGTNEAGAILFEAGDVDAAFAAADLVVEERLECNRHAAVPLETRGLVAEIAADGTLTVFGAAKVPHVNRRILAGMLDWPEEQIRLVELNVGGAFGARGEFYPEDFLIPFCAISVGCPVSWIEDRAEHFRACNHSREQIHEIAIAVDDDGRFLGLRDRVLNDTGAYVRTQGLLVPSMTGAFLPGPYRWPAYRYEGKQVVTSKTPAAAYRAPGRWEANFARERIIDIAAHRLEIDPVELRRRNLVQPDEQPYRTLAQNAGQPVVYDTGDYPLLLEKGLRHFEHEAMLRWRDEEPGMRLRRGIGIALFVEKSSVGLWEYGRVELTSSGQIRVHSGASSLGQGLETVLAQICAEALGVDYELVSVVHGDTASAPAGVGSYGSRATTLAGSAVLRSGARLRQRILELAASELEAASEDLDIVGDRVVVRGSEKASVSLAELYELARPAAALLRGALPGLSEEEYFVADKETYPYGLHCAAVEVDLDTGSVRIERYAVAYDVGRAINPALVEGQLVGGAAQGIAGALLEELAYDADGQLISGSFVDYLLPTAGEVPPIDVLVTEDAPPRSNPLGAKGAGEGGTAAAGAAIANAVSDAVGREATVLPLRPERVLELAAAEARG